MARSLKTRGIEVVGNLRRRAQRQHTLGRISRPDMENIVIKCDELEAAIVKMAERGDDLEEQ
jgi:hypothetical protein